MNYQMFISVLFYTLLYFVWTSASTSSLINESKSILILSGNPRYLNVETCSKPSKSGFDWIPLPLSFYQTHQLYTLAWTNFLPYRLRYIVPHPFINEDSVIHIPEVVVKMWAVREPVFDNFHYHLTSNNHSGSLMTFWSLLSAIQRNLVILSVDVFVEVAEEAKIVESFRPWDKSKNIFYSNQLLRIYNWNRLWLSPIDSFSLPLITMWKLTQRFQRLESLKTSRAYPIKWTDTCL